MRDNEVMSERDGRCERCNGTGHVILNPKWPKGSEPFQEKCIDCGGSGVVAESEASAQSIDLNPHSGLFDDEGNPL